MQSWGWHSALDVQWTDRGIPPPPTYIRNPDISTTIDDILMNQDALRMLRHVEVSPLGFPDHSGVRIRLDVTVANPLVAVRVKPDSIPVDLIPAGEVLQRSVLLDSLMPPASGLSQGYMDAHDFGWCAATEGALIDSIPAHVVRKGRASIADKQQQAMRGRGSMPKVQLRRLLPPRLIQDETMTVVLRIDLASKAPLGVTLSHSDASKTWRVRAIGKGAVSRHNSATKGSELILTGDILYSINGSTNDLDLELPKAGPHALHIQRARGTQTLDAPAPVWVRVWAKQSRRLAVVTTYETRRYDGKHFSQPMREDEIATWKAFMRCGSFPGKSFQAWTEHLRPDWTGPVEALDLDSLLWIRAYIEARLSQAMADLKNERRILWQGRLADDAKAHHKLSYRLLREPPLPEVSHVDRRDTLAVGVSVVPGQARLTCLNMPDDIGPGSVVTFDTLLGARERAVLARTGATLTFAKRIPQPRAGETVTVHTKMCDIAQMHKHACQVWSTITNRHSVPCDRSLDQVAAELVGQEIPRMEPAP